MVKHYTSDTLHLTSSIVLVFPAEKRQTAREDAQKVSGTHGFFSKDLSLLGSLNRRVCECGCACPVGDAVSGAPNRENAMISKHHELVPNHHDMAFTASLQFTVDLSDRAAHGLSRQLDTP